MAKITEEKLDSDKSIDKYFSEIQSTVGRFLYPVRNSKSAKYKSGYGLQIVEFVPSFKVALCRPAKACVIPIEFDENNEFCLTYEMLNNFTFTNNGKEWVLKTDNGDYSFDDLKNPWKFVTIEDDIYLNGHFPSLLIKKDNHSDGKLYVNFLISGALRPNLKRVRSLQGYGNMTSDKRKGLFDSASRVVLYDGTRPQYVYADELLHNRDKAAKVGPGDVFYLYQYRRPDPEECGSSFDPDAVKIYSDNQRYGLGKKYVKFRIVEYFVNQE